jgi:hypothetical protein
MPNTLIALPRWPRSLAVAINALDGRSARLQLTLNQCAFRRAGIHVSFTVSNAPRRRVLFFVLLLFGSPLSAGALK